MDCVFWTYRFIVMFIFFLIPALFIAVYRWVVIPSYLNWDYMDIFEDLIDVFIDGDASCYTKAVKTYKKGRHL